MGIGALIGAALFAGASLVEGRRARKESKRAARAQQRAERLKERRAAIESAREAQRARAEVQAQGVNQGIGSSSTFEGAVSSVEQTGAGNLDFLSQIQGFNVAAARHMKRSAKHSGRATEYGQFASILSTFAGPGKTQSGSNVQVVDKSIPAGGTN